MTSQQIETSVRKETFWKTLMEASIVMFLIFLGYALAPAIATVVMGMLK